MRYAALLGVVLLGVVAWLSLRTARVERPNVLLVTIDTLRPDAVGSGTPAMDAFLATAARFPRTRTVAPLTLPSHVSMLTGLLPARHGIHDNVTAPLPADRPFPLLAEQFRDRGYSTAAFVASSVLGTGTGLSQGFETYDAPAHDGAGEGQAVPGDERVNAAITYLEGARGRPWFVWVHLFDPHAPYEVFPGDDRRAATREGDPPYALYLGDVRRADAALGKLMAAAGEKTVVVLASDHGESFGEHGEHTHGALCYGATADTLLAIRAPGFAAGTSDAGLRSVADIAPTLRRLCGLPGAPSDGLDLGSAPHETLVTESLFTWRVHGWGQCFAATDGVFTLVETGPRLELFDRRADPGEEHPLPLAQRAYETLDRALERFRSGASVDRDGELFVSLPAYGQARRHVTGYLARADNGRLRDPAPHLGMWMAIEDMPWIVHRALERKDRAPLEAALRMLDEISEATPESPLVPYRRARVLEAMAQVTGEPSWLNGAAAAQLEAVEKGYDTGTAVEDAITTAVAAGDADVLKALAAFLRRDGRKIDPGTERAIAEAERAIAERKGQ
ncbi:MAG TPA: sulfatase [Planctomycetota bacterium]|nr:sulfatase [Planctomycetota bacterium]